MPIARRLRERLREHRVGGGVGARRRVLEVGEEDGRVVPALERLPAGQALVQQAPERVDVGAAVDLVATNQLRRDVVDRPHQLRVARGGTLVGETLRQAEVGEVRVAAPVDQHVRRLHVPVHQPARVRSIEGSADLDGDGDRLLVGSGPSPSRAFRSDPSTYRIAMKSLPSASPAS